MGLRRPDGNCLHLSVGERTQLLMERAPRARNRPGAAIKSYGPGGDSALADCENVHWGSLLVPRGQASAKSLAPDVLLQQPSP